MKKLLVMICVLALVLLGGCKNSDKEATPSDTENGNGQESTNEATEKEDSEIVVSWWGNQVRNEATQEVLDLFAQENPGITFDGQFSEGKDYWNKLATSAAGNNLPDIVQMDYAYIEQYAGNDLLLDLTPYVESGAIDTTNSNQDVLNSGKVGDGLYGLCIGINAPALLYNKTLLDENGITVKDNMTIDEFIDVSKQIYEKTGYKTNISYGISVQFLEYYLRAKDISLFDNGTMGGGSADPYIDYFKIYEQGMNDGWHIDSSVFAERTIGSPEQDTLVYGSSPENMSWCAFVYSNQLTAYKNAAPEGMELGVTTWPSDDPKKSNYLKPSQFFSVSKDTKNVDAVIKLLNDWTNSVEYNEILLGERGVPLSAEVASGISSKLDENGQRVVDYINNVVSDNSSQINAPYPDGAGEVTDVYWQILEKMCYGQISAEDAGTEMYEKGNEILKAIAD